MGKRTAVLYCTLILLFSGMIYRLYSVSMGDTLLQAAASQSTYTLDVAKSRGMIYDSEMRPMVATREQYIAAILPCPESTATLAAAYIKSNQPEKIAREQPTSPYTVTLPTPDVYSKGIDVFAVPKRYDYNQLAPHIIGYLDSEEEKGVAGIEMAYDELLSSYSGGIQMKYFVDALGNPSPESPPQRQTEGFRQPGGRCADAGQQDPAGRPGRGPQLD